DRVFGGGDGGVHEDTVGPQFHGDGGVRRSPHAGIHDHRHLGDHFTKNLEVGGVLNAHAGADGGSQRHHGSRAGVDELARVHHVVIGVRKNDETLFDQNAGRFQQAG